jgi:hypothetical protein
MLHYKGLIASLGPIMSDEPYTNIQLFLILQGVKQKIKFHT